MITIYGLTDNGKVFYIGQTTSITDRMYGHKSTANNKGTKKEKRIYSILKNGRELHYKILAECQDEDALKLECFYINEYLERGVKLVNENNPLNVGKRKNYSAFNEKELHLLQLLADDYLTKDIAKLLQVSERTIESRRNRIRKKAGAKHIGGLIYKAYKMGVIK